MRSLVLSCLVPLLWFASPARGAAPEPTDAGEQVVSEAELIDAALQNPGFVAQQQAEVDLAQGDRLVARRRLNPRLEYNREQIMSPRPQGEDYLIASQTFDLAGRRRLRTAAAAHRSEATEQQLASQRAALVAELRRAYALTLFAQEQARVCEQWRSLLQETLAQARSRGATDRRAQLEVQRIEQELEHATLTLELLRDDRIANWTVLRELTLDPDLPVEPSELAGPLAPATTRTDDPRDTPELRALELEVAAAERDLAVARRGWVPGLTLLFGYKGVQMLPGHGYGFVAGFALTIPILDVGRGERRRAEALLIRAQAQSSLVSERLTIARAGLHARLDDFAAEARDPDELVTLARDAYADAEIDVATVLDAYRAWVDGQAHRLDRALQARLAQVELDRLDGRSEL